MIQVINRALNILEFLAHDPEHHKSLSEISEELNLNHGTCANIIKTLVSRNYIEKLDKRKGYCLGSKIYGLTGSEGYKKDLTEMGKEECTFLTKKIKENSLLAVLDQDMRSVLVRIMSTHPIQASTASKKRAYNSSSGRVLVAMLTDTDLEKFIRQYGPPKKNEWEGVWDEKSLMDQIAKIRQNGYAIQLTKEKIVGIAVPVFRGEKAICSLSIYMPQFRYNELDKTDLITLMKQSGKKISKKLNQMLSVK
jgi:DNA-binding IclR family transcriptional regulator